MRVSVALALVVALARPEVRAAGTPDVPEANRKLVAAMRASDRDEAALEAALVTALANGAKLKGPGVETTQRELSRLLGALRTHRSEKAGLVAKTEMAAREAAARNAEEAAKRAQATQPCGRVFSVIMGVILATIAIIFATVTSGGTDPVPNLSASLVPVLAAAESLTTTVHRSLAELSRTATGGDASAIASAMVTTSQANTAARQANARLQASARLQTPAAAAPKPLANPLLPSPPPKTPPR